MELFIFIFFGVWMYIIGSKIDALTEEVRRTQQAPGVAKVQAMEMPKTAPVQMPQAIPMQSIPTPAYTAEQREVPRQSTAMSYKESEFEIWLKKDFMVKLGAFLFLLALGWFVSYAFANNWIGPVGRITFGILLGVAFLALGTWRIRKYEHQGGIFTAIGSTTILLTITAARQLYDFFTPSVALTIMFMSIAYVAFVSVRYDQKSLAVTGLVLASIAPLLVIDPEFGVFEMFSYLLVVVLGTLWVVNVRRWSILTFISLIVVFLYGLPYLSVSGADQDIALLFSFIFTTVFFIANIVGVIFNETNETKQIHITIGLGTGMYLIMWILAAASPEWQSLLCVAWMLVFAFGSYIVYRNTEKSILFYIYTAISFLLLVVATAIELDSSVFTIALATEILFAILLTSYALDDHRVTTNVSLLFFIPCILSFESLMSYSWRNGISYDHLFVLLTVGLAFAIGGLTLLDSAKRHMKESHLGAVFLILGSVYGLTLIWRIFHATMADDIATTFSLIIYTLIGIPLFVMGRFHGNKIYTWSGSILVGLVIARLLFIDVWNMALTERIITFFVIGALLMSTAFIKQKSANPELQ
ncbi:MAG: DUF2339 domain-containing protein [Candidatus Kaiserbacteria bacterium]|nr:DUF2339 domain-containing protein [Candidatus Kaiserbacteria bacterium]